ncbi:MAG: PUR family DNA/RNA-binding protein [Ferruginibacter sp.]|nr:PUR family DNA/RNA-binding protein [Ferruginibacter sp.]
MAYDNNEKKMDSVYSKRIRAGKRRTYFFDVRETRGNDYYLTITESRKRFDSDGYDRHKIFLYKEDFNKFIKGLNEAVDYVKTELMPDFDFDAFNHDAPYEGEEGGQNHGYNNEAASPAAEIVANVTETPVEKLAAENVDTPTETNSGTADNGSAEVAEKW